MDLIRALLQRRRAEREIDDELAFHIAMETEANRGRGMSPDAARLAALRSFGGVAQAKALVRDVRTFRIESLWQDLCHAAHTLFAQWRFTVPAVSMLALAIGIATAMFTIIDALVLRPVPFTEPERLAHLWMTGEHGGLTLVQPPVLRAWRNTPGIEAAESALSAMALVEIGDTVATRRIAAVTPGLFTMLGGVRPVRGRLFTATEGRPGEDDRVLISEAAWRTLFNADPQTVGRVMTVDGERLTVVGILPAAFRFPSWDTDLWRPTQLSRQDDEMALAYVRFAAGAPREEVLRRATAMAHAADARTASLRARVSPLVDVPDNYSARALPLLGGAVVLVFFVLCANVCGLLLARLTGRWREFGTRAAIGASRGRLIQQALVESGLLGFAGLTFGVMVAWALVGVARTLLPEPVLLQTLNPMNIDRRALAVTSAAGILATIAAGLLPAWLGTRIDAIDALRVAERGGSETRRARALTRVLLIVEVSLACTLLIGATLLTRSFVNLARADRGLDVSGVTSLWLSLPATAGDAASRPLLAHAVEDDVRQLPGVHQIAWSYGVPPHHGILSFGDWLSDVPASQPVNMMVDRYLVSPEFFSLYRIPIVHGRTFDRSDPKTSVIVSERFAQALWPGRDAVGRTFKFESEGTFHVIGVTREINYPSMDASVDLPEYYQPYAEMGSAPMLSLRCNPRCPDAAVIRRNFAAAHPDISVEDAVPVDARYLAELARPRASAALATTFALIALVAVAGGLFSILSYAVTRRRREFGIRSALGASPQRIRRLVLRDGVVVGAIGLGIGALVAATLARTLATLQYGVTAADPVSCTIVFGVLSLIVLGASSLPARAASVIDPLVLLREE
jgi:predicted permease